jgi:hypothetical protein
MFPLCNSPYSVNGLASFTFTFSVWLNFGIPYCSA